MTRSWSSLSYSQRNIAGFDQVSSRAAYTSRINLPIPIDCPSVEWKVTMTNLSSRFLLVLALAGTSSRAQTVPPAQVSIEVTATKIAEDVQAVPASITIIEGDELRARGAHDLASALRFVAGVTVIAGGDSGPAGSVPEMWGIREADAFLLVVDGVPWGGAFNPDVTAVDLDDVERIEVVRGSAPVMYGATSFTGVIHVIHRQPGSAARGKVSVGTDNSGSITASLPLAQREDLRHSVTASYARRGFADEKSGLNRAHLLYRGAMTFFQGTLRFDFDALRLQQSPSSPHPREGRALSPRVALDANHNPAGAKLDQDTLRAVIGFERPSWSTTVSIARSQYDIRRGFLDNISSGAASGFNQDRSITDAYFDAHRVFLSGTTFRTIVGVDHLYGNGHARSDRFDYVAGGSTETPTGDSDITEKRNFSGLYAQTEWTPAPSIRIDAGLRLNHTDETKTSDEPRDQSTVTRGSGSLGATWQAIPARLAIFANARNTFKPAAFDFGPESDGELLRPESGKSIEAGAKGSFGTASNWQATVFRNDLTNLLVPSAVNGQPQLVNGGTIRVDGAEFELGTRITPALGANLAYAYHDARFRDFEQAFGGILTQLAGHRFEMSPLHSLALGTSYAPSSRWSVHSALNYTGERYLNKRNTAPAAAFTTWSAGAAMHVGRGELRLDGENLTGRRDAVAESELGDAQYYRLPARAITLSYDFTF